MAERTKKTSYIGITKEAGRQFLKDEALTLAAALAFYAALSLAPLLVLCLWIARLLGEGTQDRIVEQVTTIMGSQAGDVVRDLVQNANVDPTANTIAGVVGIATLVFGATTLFAHLQHALNLIWGVRPEKGGARGFLRKRLLSLCMIVVLALLLLASVVASAVLSVMAQEAAGTLPGSGWGAGIVNALLSLLVFTLVVAAAFKVLPDVRIGWKSVWGGAIVTGVLLLVGKQLVGWYLGRGTVGSAYGAAGSAIVLMAWVYYSAVILFFGAELTEAWAKARGERIVPDEGAEWIEGRTLGGAA